MMIIEILYYITNKPYFFVNVISNFRVVKKFVQLASSEKDGEDFFLINKSLKCAWSKPDNPVIDKLKFITYVNLNNAIPLIFESETKIEADSDYYSKEIKESIISEDIEKQKKRKKTGKSEELIEIPFPPTVLFQKNEGHFIRMIMSAPPDKWDNLKWVFIIGIIVLGVIVWNITTNGLRF